MSVTGFYDKDVVQERAVHGGSTITVGTVTVVHDTVTEIIAANANRRKVTIENIDATHDIAIGPATVTYASGLVIGAGANVALMTKAAISGIGDGINVVNARYLEEA